MRALFLGLSVVVLVFPAQAGAEFVWVDADGRVITPFLATQQTVILTGSRFSEYVDDAGLFWVLDPETATVSVLFDYFYGDWFYTETGLPGTCVPRRQFPPTAPYFHNYQFLDSARAPRLSCESGTPSRVGADARLLPSIQSHTPSDPGIGDDSSGSRAA